jgi:putative ABC transport system substrate-binding protein
MKRREFIALLGGTAVAWPLPARAEQSAGKVARLGFLGGGSASGYARPVEALRAGLRDLGYVEGQNIHIEFAWADGKYERLPDLARNLVHLKVDLIVTHGLPGTSAAKQATETIPIVMAIVGDAVAFGLVTNVARPGGNLTGSTFFGPQIIAKRLELLKDAVPKVSRVAILFNPDNRAMGAVLNEIAVTARALVMELQHNKVREPSEFDRAFAAIAKEGADALVIIEDGLLVSHVRQIADLAVKHRLPSIGFKEYAQAGGLFAYAVEFLKMWRRAAVFVDKILRGAKAADLPIEQATHFEFIINLKTAKAIGLEMPPSLLARADEVIE